MKLHKVHQLQGTFKVPTSAHCEKLKTFATVRIGHYYCGFRLGKSNIDQIFSLYKFQKKTHENQVDTQNHIFDYKTVFGFSTRELVFAVMSKNDIPAKLIS